MPYLQLTPVEKTRRILSEIGQAFSAQAVCLHDARQISGAPFEILHLDSDNYPAETAPLQMVVCNSAMSGEMSEPHFIIGEEIGTPHFATGLLLPLETSLGSAGSLGLFWRKPLGAAARAHLAARLNGDLGSLVELLRLHLENVYLETVLSKNVSSAQSILTFAEALGDGPSPQKVVDILVENLLDLNSVSACALLMFGATAAGSPDRPDYLEVRGTWSRRLGSGIAMGVRIYLNQHPQLLPKLKERRVLTFHGIDQLELRDDLLVAAWLRKERIRSGVLIGFQIQDRPLGLLAIGTDTPHEFSARELHDYRTIAEFLSISVMAQSLQQQRDSVQQGRAALIESVTNGVVMVMPHAESGGSILTVNQPFKRMFNLADSVSLQGMKLAQLIDLLPLDEETRAQQRQAWLNINIRDASIQQGEFAFTNEEGRRVDIHWYSAPVYQDGRVIGRIYTFDDVSAERAAARLRATFLSRVSHELRTPLTSIQGFADFLLQNAGDLPPMVREYIEIIFNSARQLKFLVNDLIDIGRANAGALILGKQTCPLPTLVSDVVNRLQMELRARRQTVTFDFPDDLPPVEIDYERMVQVFSNLIGNASKFAPEGGSIAIAAHLVRSSADLADRFAPPDITLPALVVTVLDSGAGLSPDDAEQIFLPFYRTSSAKARKVDGYGLGLAIAQSLIEAHRGKIWAVPVPPASGGCFRLTIPVAR